MNTKWLISLGLLVSVAACANAADNSYYFDYDCGTHCAFKSISGATNGQDSYDIPLYPGPQSNMANVAIYKINGVDGWDSNNGFYALDVRDQLQPGQTVTVSNICVWAGPQAQGQKIYLTQFSGLLDQGLSYKLKLISVPTGINYQGPYEWGPGNVNITLPFFSTDDGTKGYKFQAVLTAVPEPSSMLALFGGITAVGGLALKRRK